MDASSHVPHFAEVCNIDGQSFQRQTKQRLAFGVDENTAYFWRPGGQEYEVVGENGVVIYEGTVGDAEKQVTTMHFLTQGDTYSPTTGDVTYSSDKKVCGEGPRPSGSNSVRTVEKHKIACTLLRAPSRLSRMRMVAWLPPPLNIAARTNYLRSFYFTPLF